MWVIRWWALGAGGWISGRFGGGSGWVCLRRGGRSLRWGRDWVGGVLRVVVMLMGCWRWWGFGCSKLPPGAS